MLIDFPSNSDYIIGVDEVGRGPLAGPVVVSAILVDKSVMDLPVKDSKLLSIKKRDALFQELKSLYKYSIAIVSPADIDKLNILNATKKAMSMAITELKCVNDCPVFVDGNFTPYDAPDIKCIIKGDIIFKPISAASIIAKVFRDELMTQYSKDYPMYDWHKNMGYGTKVHIDAIRQYGLTPLHRRSFVKNLDLGNAEAVGS